MDLKETSNRWLTKCLVGTVTCIAGLTILWSGSCITASFMDKPLAEHETCKNHDDRGIQVLLALLATLISLRSNPPE